MAKFDAARKRVAKISGQIPKVILCYEAGHDGSWLARLLEQRGIDILVMDPAMFGDATQHGHVGHGVVRLHPILRAIRTGKQHFGLRANLGRMTR